MKNITAILIITGLMFFGCAHPDNINTLGAISNVVIPSTLDEKFKPTSQIVVSDPATLLQIELFLTDHSSGWETTWHTPMSPHEYILIHQTNGDSFSFGYASKFLIKYTQHDYRYKQVNQGEIERLKSLLKTIKTSSNQQVEPIVKTPVDKVEAQSTQAHP